MRTVLGGGVAAGLFVVATAGALGGSGGGIITTVAGNGAGKYSNTRDDGPATAANLYLPTDVAVDANGNVYVSDEFFVRKVTPDCLITAIAGTGELYGVATAPSGDGGPARSARLDGPAGLAFDRKGNLYIAENGGSRVRKVSPNGIITTFAGSPGLAGFSGDGGPATSAKLSGVTGVAVDQKGNVYISGSGRVRKVSPNGIITTFAGGGRKPATQNEGPARSMFFDPRGIAVDKAGNLYVADQTVNHVYKVTPSGRLTRFAGNVKYAGGLGPTSGDGGPATSATLVDPWGVAVDKKGNVYITEVSNRSRIRRVSTDGTITTVAGGGKGASLGDGGPATAARLVGPQGVVVDQYGSIYIADTHSHRVRKVWASKPPKSGCASKPVAPPKAGEQPWPPLPSALVAMGSVSNGCGGGKASSSPRFLDRWTFWNFTLSKKYSVNFREACNLHDAGYSGAKVNDSLNEGRVIDYFTWTRRKVDQKLLADMRLICSRSIPKDERIALGKCKGKAQDFYVAVRASGSSFWRARPKLGGLWSGGGITVTITQGVGASGNDRGPRYVRGTWTKDDLKGEFRGTLISQDQGSVVRGFARTTVNGEVKQTTLKITVNPNDPNAIVIDDRGALGGPFTRAGSR